MVPLHRDVHGSVQRLRAVRRRALHDGAALSALKLLTSKTIEHIRTMQLPYLDTMISRIGR